MLLCAVVTCLIKRIKYESVFVSMFSTKQVCMTSLAGDARTPWTRSVSKIHFIINYNKTINYFFFLILKLLIYLDLNILQNIWYNASTQVSKIYNTFLGVFGYFNKKISYIAPLSDCYAVFSELNNKDMIYSYLKS